MAVIIKMLTAKNFSFGGTVVVSKITVMLLMLISFFALFCIIWDLGKYHLVCRSKSLGVAFTFIYYNIIA